MAAPHWLVATGFAFSAIFPHLAVRALAPSFAIL
jgi:hypothetical protein